MVIEYVCERESVKRRKINFWLNYLNLKNKCSILLKNKTSLIIYKDYIFSIVMIQILILSKFKDYTRKNSVRLWFINMITTIKFAFNSPNIFMLIFEPQPDIKNYLCFKEHDIFWMNDLCHF